MHTAFVCSVLKLGCRLCITCTQHSHCVNCQPVQDNAIGFWMKLNLEAPKGETMFHCKHQSKQNRRMMRHTDNDGINDGLDVGLARYS